LIRNHDTSFTEDDEKKVLRKIDWHIIPLAAWSCGLQYVDKSGLGAAATYGLRDDLHLVGQQFSWCVSMFYFGYLVGSFIAGRCLQYFHAGKVIGIAYFVWGCTLLGCVGAQNFGTLLALRFLLGLFESALVPGLLLITTMWYRQQEQSLRFGLWTATNGLLPVPFLVIYWGLGHVESGPLTSWRLIFLLLGLLSCATGGLLYIWMPDSPVTAKWLSEREKTIAVKRLVDDQLGVKNTHFKWAQARECATDWRFWMMVLQMFFSQAAGNVTTNFLGIIIKGFGYTALKAQLYTAPNFAVQFAMVLVVTAPPSLSPRFRNMKQVITATASLVAVIGIVILYVTPAEEQYKSRRLASCIIISFHTPNYTAIMATIGTNTSGFTRRQLSTSMAFFLYCVVNIITPQTFLGSESPRYHTGLGFVLGMLSVFIVLAYLTALSMRLENNRRDKKAMINPAYAAGEKNFDEMSGLRDQTDIQNKHFRYSG